MDKHPLEQFVEGLHYCVGATMPSRILAEDWQWAAPCWYVPNYFDTARYLPAIGAASPDPRWVTIGYGGSMSHVRSFSESGVEEGLRRVCQKRPNVRVLICGDKRVYDRLPVPISRKKHQMYLRWNEWPKLLASFDIGLAPLHSRYDDSRSFIKPLEYTLMGIPYIATRTPAYVDFDASGIWVSGGGDQLHFDKRADEWEAALLNTVDNLEAHQKRIKDQQGLALRWDVDACVGELEATYQEIIAAR